MRKFLAAAVVALAMGASGCEHTPFADTNAVQRKGGRAMSGNDDDMMSGVFEQRTDGELRTAIPEPYWFRSQTIYASPKEYEAHYILCDLMSMEVHNVQ